MWRARRWLRRRATRGLDGGARRQARQRSRDPEGRSAAACPFLLLRPRDAVRGASMAAALGTKLDSRGGAACRRPRDHWPQRVKKAMTWSSI